MMFLSSMHLIPVIIPLGPLIRKSSFLWNGLESVRTEVLKSLQIKVDINQIESSQGVRSHPISHSSIEQLAGNCRLLHLETEH